MSSTLRRRLAAVCCAVGVAGAMVAAAPTAGAATTSDFRGVNWADPRDNYASDAVVPSGLSTTDSYATTFAKASAIIGQFRAKVGANTVRLPVNPTSVNGPFWQSYTAAVDAATAKGFKVILGYWESPTAKDGRIDDQSTFTAMWQRITTRFAFYPNVYFEPMNEPFGYSSQEWTGIVKSWLSAYWYVPRSRVVVDGTGYADDVKSVCADNRLAGTHLALHFYGFWHSTWTDPQQWLADFDQRLGTCSSRTILDEFGASMTTGLNYNGPINGSNEIAYLQTVTNRLRELHMGSVYWPGLRTGDTYSLTELHGCGTALSLTVTNASGADLLARAWGR
jgi:endoglucanase